MSRGHLVRRFPKCFICSSLKMNQRFAILGSSLRRRSSSTTSRMKSFTLLSSCSYDFDASVWSLSTSRRSKYYSALPVISMRKALTLHTGANLYSSPWASNLRTSSCHTSTLSANYPFFLAGVWVQQSPGLLREAQARHAGEPTTHHPVCS